MRALCLDTNTYGDYLQGVASAVELIESADQVWVPFVVLGELRAGFRKGSKAAENEAVLAEFLSSPFVAVAEARDSTSRIYANVFDGLRRQGKPIPANDLWVAACAIERYSALFTRDGHFANVAGLDRIETPKDWARIGAPDALR